MTDSETSQRATGAASSARLPIWRLSWLVGGLGLVATVLAGGLVLGYAWTTRPMPDETPLREANVALVDHLADNLVRRFGQPTDALQRLADRFTANDLGPDDTFSVTEALGATLGAAPGLRSIAFVGQDMRVIEGRRDGRDIAYALRDLADDPDARRQLAEVQAGGPGSSHWGAIVYSDNSLLSELAVPVYRDGRALGMLQSQVVLPEQSGGTVAAESSTPFILIGRNYVQYHPRLQPPAGGRARTATPVSELGDPAITAITERIGAEAAMPERLAVDGRQLLVHLRELPGPGGEPWYVGAYRPVPPLPDMTMLIPLGGLLGGIALAMLLLGLQLGARVDSRLRKQAAAIGSAAALKLGPRPRLPKSAIHGIEAINHAITRLGHKIEDIANLEPDGEPGEPALAALPGPVLRPRTGEALVIWIDAWLTDADISDMPAASAAVAINAELGLIADRIELEGGLALPGANAIAGVWFCGPDPNANATESDAGARLPDDVVKLTNELVGIAGAVPAAGASPRPTALFAAGVARGQVVLAEFGPPRRKRYGVAGPAAEQARANATMAAERPSGTRAEISESVKREASAAEANGTASDESAEAAITPAADRPDP